MFGLLVDCEFKFIAISLSDLELPFWLEKRLVTYLEPVLKATDS